MGFRSGGYGIRSQLIVAAVFLVLLALVVAAGPSLPVRGGLPLAAFSALLGYAVWTLLSTRWAPVLDAAAHDVDRVGMYCAAFALALGVMRVPALRRMAPDVLLAGILVVCLYALAGRLLPDVVHQRVSSVRLSQPLTYWNALGMLAGFGAVLGVTIAGDWMRPRTWRALACAAAVPCGVTVVLTLSRGAAASVLAGLVVCVALRWRRATVVGVACALVAVALASASLVMFPDALSPPPRHSAQATQGAWFLVVVVAATCAAGLGFARLLRSRMVRGELPPRPRLRAAVAVGVVPLVLLAGIAVSAVGKETTDIPTTASRITRAETNRGHYWRVALDAFGRHPLNGLGSGGFAATWRRHRGADQPALDAHSLYIETLAELGVVGALLLLAFLASVAVATVRAVRARPRHPTVVSAAAVLAAFAVHAGLDWDWEMPAVSLIAIILAACVLQPPAPARERSVAHVS